MILTKPYTVLQNRYNPIRPWKAWRIGKDLLRLTEQMGLVPIDDPNHRHQVKAAWCDVDKVAYVRRRTVKNPKAADWHQDGDLDGGQMDNSLVLWTSNTPTQLRDKEGRVWTPPNRSVILFRNLDVYHRRPPNAPHVRYLFRQRVENA